MLGVTLISHAWFVLLALSLLVSTHRLNVGQALVPLGNICQISSQLAYSEKVLIFEVDFYFVLK